MPTRKQLWRSFILTISADAIGKTQEEIIRMLKETTVMKDLATKNKVSFEEFPPENYINIALNDLLIASLFLLYEFRGKDPLKYRIRQDDWYIQTYLHFPVRWMVSQRWPILPHTERMDKRWRDLRAKGLIEGSATEGFNFSELGLRQARTVVEIIRKGTKKTPHTIENAEDISPRERKLLKRFSDLGVYQEWNGQILPPVISLQELASLLRIAPASQIVNYRRAIINYIKPGGFLDYNAIDFVKARKFLTLQGCYYNDVLGFGDKSYHKLLNKVLKDLEIVELGEQAKRKQIEL